MRQILPSNAGIILGRYQINCPGVIENWQCEAPRFEKHVLETEMAREDRVAWYRNPPRASQDSLGIVYDEADEQKIVRPDFVFFSERADGVIVADIVDPHGHHLADSLPKLKGLADYADKHGDLYGRIEAVADVDGKYRALNLLKREVRNAIAKAKSAKSAYTGNLATDYEGSGSRR